MDETNPMESTDVETVSTEPAALETQGTDPTVPDESVPETTQETEPDASTEGTETAPVETESEHLPGEDPEELDGTQATIYEDFSGSDVQATEEVTVIEIIETVGSDIAHANLFSGFLICGTLVGLALLRKIYGT